MTSSSTRSLSGDADGDGELFYESLDRILSSSNSSTSASDDEADPIRRLRHGRRSFPHSSIYDVWISEPVSVVERRRRLRLQFGLDISGGNDEEFASFRDPPSAVTEQSKPDESSDFGAAGDAATSVEVNSDDGICTGGVNNEVQFGECRIRNLDNGTEFVLRQENVWEVGTGRRLTMEEFEMCIGKSPIVLELMRRQNSSDSDLGSPSSVSSPTMSSPNLVTDAGKPRRKGNSWLRSIRNMAGNVVANASYHHRRSTGGNDMSKEKQKESEAQRASSVDEHDVPGRVRVRHYGKPYKELTAVFLTQEIDAHNGPIWTLKFSLDGRFLASAGEDRVIHVWQVAEMTKAGIFADGSGRESTGGAPLLVGSQDGSAGVALALSCIEGNSGERIRKPKAVNFKKSVGSDNVVVPKCIFGLSEKPLCLLQGHAADVLDLSWSKSEFLLSSSMDKTVKLWDITTSACLKTFSHSDYVTCIQFNPADDRFFISGSLDEKVRIWNVQDRHVVDWYDLHEMITAVCYYPDGQGALVGSHKGGCHSFLTSENKLQHNRQINLAVNKKRSHRKKITGFQFAPGSSSEVLVTSADSRIRLVSGDETVHKYKGFRNTSSQISASVSSNGKYVVCASEDSYVYVWRTDESPHHSKNTGSAGVTCSYEYFHCQDVTAAITWQGNELFGSYGSANSISANLASSEADQGSEGKDPVLISSPSSQLSKAKTLSSEDSAGESSPSARDVTTELQQRSAWGLVMVTAGQGGEIKVFQNFGLPVRI